jgi:hypothetical protein
MTVLIPVFGLLQILFRWLRPEQHAVFQLLETVH